MTNFEYYKNKKDAIAVYEKEMGEYVYNLQDGPKGNSIGTSGGRFVSWLYDEHNDFKYLVYFNAGSSNCSGWLRGDDFDIVCFEHFINHAKVFDDYDSADIAAQRRLMMIYNLIDGIKDNVGDEKNTTRKRTRKGTRIRFSEYLNLA